VKLQYPLISCQIVPSAHAALANGYDSGEPIRRRFPGKTIIGHIGALVQRHKGQRTIIAAARVAAEQFPDWHFLLVGDGEDQKEMLAEADGLKNLEFTGQVDNIADYLASFDIFVFPSLHEGLGSSLLDAMSFGLPLVASNVGGIAEIVEDRVNGILIPPNDSAALIDSLSQISRDNAIRDSMRKANLRKAAMFGADKMGARYEQIYWSILERHKAA
jgi:glycosyltransferase involved in cell wall biosynthesis